MNPTAENRSVRPLVQMVRSANLASRQLRPGEALVRPATWMEDISRTLARRRYILGNK
jgi:isocitrate dehydrogenase